MPSLLLSFPPLFTYSVSNVHPPVLYHNEKDVRDRVSPMLGDPQCFSPVVTCCDWNVCSAVLRHWTSSCFLLCARSLPHVWLNIQWLSRTTYPHVFHVALCRYNSNSAHWPAKAKQYNCARSKPAIARRRSVRFVVDALRRAHAYLSALRYLCCLTSHRLFPSDRFSSPVWSYEQRSHTPLQQTKGAKEAIVRHIPPQIRWRCIWQRWNYTCPCSSVILRSFRPTLVGDVLRRLRCLPLVEIYERANERPCKLRGRGKKTKNLTTLPNATNSKITLVLILVESEVCH